MKLQGFSTFLFFFLPALTGFAADGPFFQKGQDPLPADKKWLPVEEMSDDFEGTSVDSDKWHTNPTAGGWSWFGRPPGLFHERNVKVADGKLQVTVSQLPEQVTRGRYTFDYQGAIVRSVHPGKPGWYFEAKMKANQTAMSSTFWLMTPRGTEKKLELDIQECVGTTNDKTHEWAKDWDKIFHSNLIHRTNRNNRKKVQVQASVPTDVENWRRYFVYAAWWKSPEEVMFFLDGKHVYTRKPPITWDVPAFIQMAIETYDWNPVPDDGGLVKTGTKEQRTTSYDWVRTWKVADK